MSTPAGWYDDGTGTPRWWDGVRWTEHTAPAQPVAPAQPAATAGGFAPVETAPAAAAGPTNAAHGYAAPAYSAPAYAASTYASQPYGAAPVAPPRWNVLAIISPILWLIGFGLVGLILGIVALVQIRRRPPQRGKALAITGIVLGGLATLLTPILVAIAIPVYLSAIDTTKDVAVESFLSDVQTQLESAYHDNGEYPVSLGLEPGPLGGVDIRVGYASPTPDDYCLEAKYGAAGRTFHVVSGGHPVAGPCSADGYEATPQN